MDGYSTGLIDGVGFGFGRVGVEREILGVKEEGRGRFVVWDAGVCVWREMRRGV